MSEAAKTFMDAIDLLSDEYDVKIDRLKAEIEALEEKRKRAIDNLSDAAHRCCDHSEVDFKMDSSYDYHNNDTREWYSIRCTICGTSKSISYTDWENKVNRLQEK